MSAAELFQEVTLSREPAMFRPRPSSERTQDISHLLTSLFKDLYTGEVIGKDTGSNLIRSKGGDPYHQKFVEDLQRIRSEYDQRMAAADMVEKHIIEARARATAEEERELNALKTEAGDKFHNLGLPPVDSYFRWCVDNDIIRKCKLVCPEDYITDTCPVTKSARRNSDHTLFKRDISFHKHVSKSPVDDGYTEYPSPEGPLNNFVESSITNLTLSSTEEMEDQRKKKSRKKSTQLKKKQEATVRASEKEVVLLAQLENRHSFLKNPRFFPPNSVPGGLCSALLQLAPILYTVCAGLSFIFTLAVAGNNDAVSAAVITVVAGHCGSEDMQGMWTGLWNPHEPVPVFLANPPVIFFPDYEVGQIYETTVELRNMTASSRHVRVIPPSTPYFSIGLGKFPGPGGIVAPGMSCHYTVRFIPDCLADFEDFILVESQAPYPVLIPIEARRQPPILTLPDSLDCGPCLIGGVKLLEFICRNEGLSRGRFCMMPKSAWPPANFRSVATTGFVEQAPFGIRPAVFELYPGQETVIEVVFFPNSPETFTQVFTIVCDNCQVKDVTITGLGQLVGLELVSVSHGLENRPMLLGTSDVATGHLIQFGPANVCSTVQKCVTIRNATHVELPFYWQIMKPDSQDSLLEEQEHETIKLFPDTNTAFTLSPAEGVLRPYHDHIFTVTYSPTELKDYHNIAHMILRNIPEPPSAGKQPKNLAELDLMISDVIVMDLDLRGATEPFNILLEPYAIFFPGENFINTTMRKQFKMWNNSINCVHYTWENIASGHIIQIEPSTGYIEPNTFCEFELCVTGGQSGFISQKVNCYIRHSPEPIVLHMEATFKGPVVSMEVPSLDFGLIKLGNKSISVFTIQNKSPLPANWSMYESRACLAETHREVSQLFVHPDSGKLPPLGSATVSVIFQPLVCQRLQTVLDLEIEQGERSHLPVTADVQIPQVCLLCAVLQFTDVYVDVPTQSTVKIFNQGKLPAKFSWGELLGAHSNSCSASITPASGMLGPNEEAELCVHLTAHTLDELSDISLCCTVEDMKEPLVLNMRVKANGLHVSYCVPGEEEKFNQLCPSSGQELLLDFGSEVLLNSTVQRKLIITNHSGIPAPFSLEAAYFTGSSGQRVHENKSSTRSLIHKSSRFTAQAANKAQAEYKSSVLAHGKGAAFIPQPASGTLGAFQRLEIRVSAYSNMWGVYSDELVCRVGNLKPKRIPIKMTVVGCPIYFQMTGPRADRQTQGPIIRFGTHVSGGDTISRYLRINNTSPCDIRIDWETYNKEKDSKLLDLVVLYGEPFPLKDIDGNEIDESRMDLQDSKDSSENWDKIPSTSGTRSTVLSRTNNVKNVDQSEDDDEEEESKDESRSESLLSPENKLISVILRTHDGIASDYPYCITPRQTIVPAGGSCSIHVSFTPLMLSGVTNKVECSGYALGFMSLDDKFAQLVSGKVKRPNGYGVEPIRVELQSFVKPALLTVEVEGDDSEGLVFYTAASDLIPNGQTSQILTELATTRNLKLINSTETPLYFRLLLSKPFSVSTVDLNKSIKTSHSDREEQGDELVLYPQQNLLVKVSFCTTLELLTYQRLPAEQMLPGVQLLHSETGERKLRFTQNLVIEYSNKGTQHVPLQAYITVPVLQLSCQTVDFGTCFVGQTKSQEVCLLNKSGSRSYWMALLDKEERHSDQEIFSISPSSGILGAHLNLTSASKESIQITFTARTSTEYETTVVIHGLLGEEPLELKLKGCGSNDERYEALHSD
ncbi:LOW QUALITY PROTEIN: deleted in lung and esophageal cancer protein 1 [Bombina bombina]|uniref:LOW QUALITY PROTEIN: deleted in lung and esophageal cancer protein 1 n=1 Tax=Bombina bombina TaxID=8345 RepID=UPI00235AABF2|nr:LOW QUALITY PROTEIN: deleted in lung and esophageal cancer protein 1 [Bombina bombina]